MARFENMHVSLQELPPSTRGQGREVDATVYFVRRGVKVLEGSKWWFRGNSHGIQKLEMDMVECMH
jgi:hypothetical protein